MENNDNKSTIESLAIVAVIFCVLFLIALPVGLGYLLGAGAGWLGFALICLGLSYTAIHRAKQIKKEEGGKAEGQDVNEH